MLEMYKELKWKEQQKYMGLNFAPFSISKSDANEYCKYVPRLNLDPRARLEPEYIVSLRTLIPQLEKHHYFPPYFCGRSTSTYPYIEAKGGRDGEPICDQYNIMFSPPLSIIAVADGCNWGTGPAEAAYRASKAFVDHMNKSRDLFRSTNLVAHLCLDGIVAAHNAIIAGPYIEGKSIGTTTLLGGVLVKVILPQQKNTSPKDIKDWVFVFASIGDCKAFLWDSKKKIIEELTPDSRGDNFMDASDCGGRIGPYINGGPDLRNLEVFMAPCAEGDLIFVCSDGVHDNFDPQFQGISPKDLGSDIESWNEIEPDEANALKSAFRCSKLNEVIDINNKFNGSTIDLPEITNTIVDYCINMNHPSQVFMQENLGKRLPNDYTCFPGKMDHTTLAILKVGEYEPSCFDDYISRKKHEHKQSSTDGISENDLDDGIELLLAIKSKPRATSIQNANQLDPKLLDDNDASMAEIKKDTKKESSIPQPATLSPTTTKKSNVKNDDDNDSNNDKSPRDVKKEIHPRRRGKIHNTDSPRSLLRRKNTIEIRPGQTVDDLVKEVKELLSFSAIEYKALCTVVTKSENCSNTGEFIDILKFAIEEATKRTVDITEFARRLGYVGEGERIKSSVVKLIALAKVCIN